MEKLPAPGLSLVCFKVSSRLALGLFFWVRVDAGPCFCLCDVANVSSLTNNMHTSEVGVNNRGEAGELHM